MPQRIGILLLIAILGVFCLQLGERLSIPGVSGFVSTADARVGRPMTPVSVAGAARRTVRRCAAGVYYC
jgi:hypothetical protein